jgi:hypothetical protein
MLRKVSKVDHGPPECIGYLGCFEFGGNKNIINVLTN